MRKITVYYPDKAIGDMDGQKIIKKRLVADHRPRGQGGPACSETELELTPSVYQKVFFKTL